MEKLTKEINGQKDQTIYRTNNNYYISRYGIIRLLPNRFVRDYNIDLDVTKEHTERCDGFLPGNEERIEQIREVIRKVCFPSEKITRKSISYDLVSLFNDATGHCYEFSHGETIVAMCMEGYTILHPQLTGCTFNINVDEFRGAFRVLYPRVCWKSMHMN